MDKKSVIPSIEDNTRENHFDMIWTCATQTNGKRIYRVIIS